MADEPTKPRRTRKAEAPVEVPTEAEAASVPEPSPEPEAPRLTPTQKIAGKGAPPGLRRPIEQGDRGDRVIDVQERLAKAGYYDGKISGLFGYETMRAVRRLQGANGMRPSGVVDAATWAALTGK